MVHGHVISECRCDPLLTPRQTSTNIPSFFDATDPASNNSNQHYLFDIKTKNISSSNQPSTGGRGGGSKAAHRRRRHRRQRARKSSPSTKSRDSVGTKKAEKSSRTTTTPCARNTSKSGAKKPSPGSESTKSTKDVRRSTSRNEASVQMRGCRDDTTESSFKRKNLRLGSKGHVEEMDVRTWFENLACGQTRAQAMAISDNAFIKSFLQLSSDHSHLGASKSFLSGASCHEVVEKMSMEEFVNLYTNNSSSSRNGSSESGTQTNAPLKSSTTMATEEQLPSSPPKEMEGEEFASTAFRIPKQGGVDGAMDGAAVRLALANEASGTKTYDEEANSEEAEPLLTTTLHFESGLSLPISTKSVSNKKVIATKGKRKESSSIFPLQQSLSSSSSDKPSREGNDVHNHMIFSALDVSTSQSADKEDDSTSSKPNSNSTIASNPHSFEDDFFGHVRVAFTEAIKTSKGGKANEKKQNQKGGVEFLTLDPEFLNQRGEDDSLKFLRDVDNIIGCEMKKLKQGTADGGISNVRERGYFLKDRIQGSHTDEAQNGDGVPEWMLPFINSRDRPIRLLLILLARIEQAIRNSHKQHIQEHLSGKGMKCKDALDKHRLVETLSSSPSRKKEDEQSSTRNDGKQHLEISSTSEEVCKPIILTSKNNPQLSTILTEVFNTWKGLHLRKEKDDIIISKIRDLFRSHLTGKRLKALSFLSAEDLVLVPLSSVCTIKDKGDTSSGAHVEEVVTEWNKILKTVFKEAKKDFNQLEWKDLSGWHEANVHVDEIDMFDDSLFANDDVKKPGNGKKKKKKKKKKKSKNANQGLNSNDKKKSESERSSCNSNGIKPSADEGTRKRETPFQSNSALSKQSISPEKDSASRVGGNVDVTQLKTDITVSRFNGMGGTCVVGGGRFEDTEENDDGDAWETVESKGTRVHGKGKKSNSSVNVQPSPGNRRRNKNKGKLTKGKSKNKDRGAGIDSVEDDIVSRGVNTTKALLEERRKKSDGTRTKRFVEAVPVVHNSRALSMRDAVPRKTTNKPSRIASLHVTQRSQKKFAKVETSKSNLRKKGTSLLADQSTAPTVPETLSGVSSGTRSSSRTEDHSSGNERTENKNIVEDNEKKEDIKNVEDLPDVTCTSTEDGDQRHIATESITNKNGAPPLQTLVGPGNMNSANSSVASSLEAPHAMRRGIHTTCREDDVGYHLLKVCERISEDMGVFMRRRSAALAVRRRERGALLSALQETVQGIWEGHCHVEMYGSCATQLDLPSSDLDVVVCGFDLTHGQNDITTAGDIEVNNISDRHRSAPNSPGNSSRMSYLGQGHFYHPPLSKNGNRVIRLAEELERQSWAVQVKAIPTASVPVIKILADANRLTDVVSEMDWMLHQQQLAVATVASADLNSTILGNDATDCQNTEKEDTTTTKLSPGHMGGLGGMTSPFNSPPQPWRGADVMNGLLSLDITFEGAEHGGLGSTAFSARVVQEACNETGLAPENTPAVQVVMIIKELLAQRRLNEPFSGGLSSYAILLLVVAVIKERRVIIEEIERVERQRRAVATGTSSSVGFKSEADVHVLENKNTAWSSNNEAPMKCLPHSRPVDSEGITDERTMLKISSWAAIAKKQTCTGINSTNSATQGNNRMNDKPSQPRSSEESSKSSLLKEETSKITLDHSDSVPFDGYDSSVFPQGSNDVLEVLCSGETTAGKLLMHFLLFYGQIFDASTTCIDVSGKHHPDFQRNSQYRQARYTTPFIKRKPGGSFNPVSDVYTVDTLVAYDPLEGAEANNVARSCYAWSNISSVFGQCYNTLSGEVDRDSSSNGRRRRMNGDSDGININLTGSIPKVDQELQSKMDEVTPLLELLLSF